MDLYILGSVQVRYGRLTVASSSGDDLDAAPGGLDVKSQDQSRPGQESRLVKTPKPYEYSYSSGFCSSSVRRMPTTTFITLLTAHLLSCQTDVN